MATKKSWYGNKNSRFTASLTAGDAERGGRGASWAIWDKQTDKLVCWADSEAEMLREVKRLRAEAKRAK